MKSIIFITALTVLIPSLIRAQEVPLAPDAKPLKSLSIICAYDGLPAALKDSTMGQDGPIDGQKKLITAERVEKAMADLDPYVRTYSFGKTHVVNTTHPEVIRVPYPLGSVEQDKPAEPRGVRSSNRVKDYVVTELRKRNVAVDDYDCFVFFYPHTEGRTYGGLGGAYRYPGFKEARGFVGMEADVNVPIIAHEILHSSSQSTMGAGLPHGNSWVVTDGNPISPAGKHLEYGDIFDVMGSGQSFESHPNPAYKLAKKWMTNDNVHTVTTSGTYRIYRFDHRDALSFDGDNTKLAIKVRRETDGTKKRDYWIGYRRLVIPDWRDATLGNGAYITWDQKLNSDSDSDLVAQALLDTQTPGGTPPFIGGQSTEKSAFLDSALPVGKTLKDDAPLATRPAPICITPIAQGGTAPADYLDVVVNIGPFTGNVAPVLSGITVPGGLITAGVPVQLTANATDGNNDALAFYWEFTAPGARPAANVSTATRTHTFETGGTYTVRCTVTDMKGGEDTRTVNFTVADALTSWTARASTITSPIGGFATLGNTVVAVVGEHGQVGCVRSVNGLEWKQHRIGLDLANPNCGLHSVAAGLGKFVAVGWKDGTAGSVGYAASSVDGITWTSRSTPAVGQLRSVIFVPSDNVFYAVGDGGAIIKSFDGENWEQQQSGTTKSLIGIAQGNAGYVVVGKEQTVLLSDDAATWKNVSHDGFGTNFQRAQASIASGAGVYVACSDSRFVISSEDGKTWTKRPLPVATDYELRQIIFANSSFIAIGNKFPNGVRTPVTVQSKDGISWVERPSMDFGGNPRVVFYGNSYLGGGDDGKLGQTGALTPGAPVVTSPATTEGVNDVPFAYQIVATNSPSSFTATGLPSGIVLDTATGRISGKAGLGTSNVTIRAINASGTSADFALTLEIKPPRPAITSPGVATATPGEAFNFQVVATNNPTNYSATGLPANVTINPTTGLISGTPTQHEKATVKITVTNAIGASTAELMLTVGSPVITSPLSASGVVGQAFPEYTLTATVTMTGYNAENLPDGLTFDFNTAKISGTPTVAGVFPIKLTAQSAGNPDSIATMTLTIGAGGIDAAVGNAAPAPAPLVALRAPIAQLSLSAPEWVAGGDAPPYSQTSVVNDGVAAVQFGNVGDNQRSSFEAGFSGPGTLRFFWKVSSQLDADFLVLEIDGTEIEKISGEQDWQEVFVEIPDGAHIVTFAYTKDASQSAGADTGWVDNVDFFPGALFPEITSAESATGAMGQSFAYEIIASRDPQSYAAEGLPEGLSLDKDTGLISGVPMEFGNFFVTITATNATGESAPFDVELDIAGPVPVILGDLDISGEVDEDRFVYQIAATGSPTTYSASDLPEGFRIDPFTGIISGRPIVSGVFPVTIAAGNINGTGTATLTLTFAAREVNVHAPREAQAYPGTAFSFEIETHDSVDSFSAVGLPAGLDIDPDSGEISGIPTTTGVFTVVVTVTTNVGTTDFEFTLTVGAPNDNFDNSIALEGSAFGDEGVANGATKESGEPDHAATAAADRTLWWKWTAPRAGKVVLNAAGTGTVIAVYQGSAVDSLTDAGSSSGAEATFDAVAGNTYQIAVAASVDGDVSFTGRYDSGSEYNGLIEGLLSTDLDGFATLKVTDKLTFTGKLTIAGKKLGLKGAFDQTTGEYSGTVVRKGLPTLTVSMMMDFEFGTDGIRGSVTDGTETAGIILDSAQKVAKGASSPQTGQYTIALHTKDGNSEQSAFAQGHGFATVAVAKTGKLKLVGKLGDGSKVSQGVVLSADGSWPFFVPSAKTGAALGWVFVDNAQDLDGTITWTKPATPKGPYTSGFTVRDIPLVGARYTPPGKGIKLVGYTLGSLTLGSEDRLALFSGDNSVAVDGAKLKLTVKTGLFSGTMLDGTGKKRAFDGAIILSEETGFGVSIDGNETSPVELRARP